MKNLAFLGLLIVLTACSNDRIGGPPTPPPAPDESIHNTPALGAFFGAPWTFQQGRARNRVQGNSHTYIIELWEETYADPCLMTHTPSRSLLFIIPSVTGTYELNNNRTITFSGSGINLRATEGLYNISSIDSEEYPGVIQAGINVVYDADNKINGLLEVEICP